MIQHCIYGVDKNPLAVELCKIALWLESHSAGEPLNFLGHHIKCGDAIVGLAHRSELENGIAQFFIPKTKANEKFLTTDAEYRLTIRGYNLFKNDKLGKVDDIANRNRVFHWFLEFPEVFNEGGGFDCFLGNPPYLGGKKISGSFGDNYLSYIKFFYSPAGGLADLCVYFLRRDFDIINNNGYFSLITTNSISQGDSRVGGLEFILSENGQINHAIKSTPWPGKAAV